MSENEYRTTVITFDPFFRLPEIRGKSDSYIARKIGINADTVRNMRNREDVPLDAIRQICRALECQPGDIMGAETVYVMPAKNK